MAPDHAKPAEALPPPAADPSIAAFDRDLHALLQSHSGQWVTYQGDQRLGFGRTHAELFNRCLQRGYREDAFIVRYISTAALADHDEVNLPWNV
jgi:hypothetical protein